MLALTKKVDYGLIALCHLAHHPRRVATAREISERYHVPQALLMNVMKVLSRHGLLRSSRGPKGGYELAASPDTMTLHDIIEIVEGPIRFVQCASASGENPAERCELFNACPVSAPVLRLHQKLKSFLAEVTLAEIASDPDYGPTPLASAALTACEQEPIDEVSHLPG